MRRVRTYWAMMGPDRRDPCVSHPEHVVVVGAGLAGLRTVEELRAQGYAGAITLVGAESRPPYDRPPLSKKLMTGELDDTSLRADLGPLEVTARLDERAVALDDGAVVTTGPDGRVPFDALVLATGASPVTLPGTGRQHVLRTLDDALELRPRLVPGATVAIIGAGWIGAELATAAVHRGARVTVVEAGAAPLAGALGAEVGGLTAGWYAAAGVDLRLGQGVASVEPGGLALAGGGWLPADVVVTAVGVRPDVRWLDGSGVTLDNGVAVDGRLRSSRPGVLAVGDCAAFWSARYGRRLRFEHWDVALHAPKVAAATILDGALLDEAGRDEAGRDGTGRDGTGRDGTGPDGTGPDGTGPDGAANDGPGYDPVPYFWSEQFGRMVQYVGYHGDADELVRRGDPAAGAGAVAWLAGGRLVALLTVGLPRDLQQGRRVIAARAELDPARLADPSTPVRDCVLS
jgi:3-phenylpropionate/trans-cinnamate dioxygenase ferredoxin reductase component